MSNLEGAAASHAFQVNRINDFVEHMKALDIKVFVLDAVSGRVQLKAETNNGTWPNWYYDPNTDDEQEVNLVKEIRPFLKDDQIVVLYEVGWERLDLIGHSIAFAKTGEVLTVDLDDIVDLAVTRFKHKI